MDAKGQLFLWCIVVSLVSIGVKGQVCTNIQSNPYTKIWTVALGHDWGAYEYINEGGYVTGFSMDMIEEVCKAANINCRTMWLAYTSCWESQKGAHSYGGDALLGSWVDACTGWIGTIDRIHVFDFSMPFLNEERAFFYSKRGNPFDTKTITNAKIGFLDGWAADEKCLVRKATQLKATFLPTKENVFYYATSIELAKAIQDGTVNAGFSNESAMKVIVDGSTYNLERKLADGYSCGITGNGMMTRKDSDFIHYWNIGFMKIRNNGHFKKLCEKGRDNHSGNGNILCVDT